VATATLEKQAVSVQESCFSMLLDGPKGTVLANPDCPGEWWVKGSEQVYLVTLKPDTCECKSHQFRGRCSHVEAVKAHLQDQLSCPACGEYATSSLEYTEVLGYVLRATCGGGCGWRRVI
jgi:hypothetical protein